MPTYEYRCPKGHAFDVFQKMSDEPVATCPECGEKAERLLSAGAGLLFKGEGFYITDYRSDSYRKAAEKEKPGGGEKAGGAEKAGSGEKAGGGEKGAPAAGGSGGSSSSTGSGSSSSSSD